MAAGDALSKSYTFEDIVNRVLSRLQISEPEGGLLYKIQAEINAAQKVLASELLDDPVIKSLYEQGASLSFAGGECTFNAIEQANPLIKEPLRVDVFEGSSRVGEATRISPNGFKHIHNNVLYDNTLVYTFEGRRILLYAGQNMDVTIYNFKLIYTRFPNKLVQRDDKMDLPDNKFTDLVERVYSIFQSTPKEPEENN